MEIGEFSKETGITIDTLRYYNKINLLVPKRINNRRWYTKEDLEKANAIMKLKNFNFTLEEIKALFDLDRDINENEVINNENRVKINCCFHIIEKKYNEILRKEQELSQVKFALKKMIEKTNKLLETGRFPIKEDEESNHKELKS